MTTVRHTDIGVLNAPPFGWDLNTLKNYLFSNVNAGEQREQ